MILSLSSVAGLLKDTYGKYDYSFYFGGSAIFLGSAILLSGNIRNFYDTRRKKEATATSKQASQDSKL